MIGVFVVSRRCETPIAWGNPVVADHILEDESLVASGATLDPARPSRQKGASGSHEQLRDDNFKKRAVLACAHATILSFGRHVHPFARSWVDHYTQTLERMHVAGQLVPDLLGLWGANLVCSITEIRQGAVVSSGFGSGAFMCRGKTKVSHTGWGWWGFLLVK